MKIKNIFITFLLLTTTILVAQNKFSTNTALFSCIAQQGDKVLFSHNPHVPIIPASILKIVTTSTALEVLGPNYQYKTRIGYKGNIKNGILYGDLVIVSGNDPTLGSEFFDTTNINSVFNKIKTALINNNIQSINGNIEIQHNGHNVAYPSSRLWEDMGNYYGGIPHYTNFKDNTIRITLQSKGVGSAVKVIKTNPHINYYSIESKAIASTHQKDSAYVYGINQTQHWWIEGSIPANRNAFIIKAAMPDPSMVLVSALKEYLIKHNITFSDTEYDSDQISTFELLCEAYSPPLSKIIEVTNHNSNNLFADQLFLTLGKKMYGTESWSNGAKAISNFWKNKINFSSNFKIKDGSGLSPKNLITTNGIVQLLTWMKKHSTNFNVFVKSLAVGGHTGTLKNVFKNPKIIGKIIGKSGSMESVVTYCGYYIKSNKTYIPFCIAANHFLVSSSTARRYIDKYITNKFTL